MDQNEKYLKFIKPIAWDEVFNLWEENEAKQEYWIAHYKKRGFNSWKEWRADTIKAIDSRNKTWELHEIVNPMEYVPRFFGGPFRSWIKNVYQGKKTLSFSEIANNPQIQKKLEKYYMKENWWLQLDKNYLLKTNPLIEFLRFMYFMWESMYLKRRFLI